MFVGWFRQDKELTNNANDTIGLAAGAAILKRLGTNSQQLENSLHKCQNIFKLTLFLFSTSHLLGISCIFYAPSQGEL